MAPIVLTPCAGPAKAGHYVLFSGPAEAGHYVLFEKDLLNTSTASGFVETFGPNWLRPTELQKGRYAKISAQLDF